MKFGFTIPNFGDHSDLGLLAELARDAEAAGWDGFFLWDHLLYGPVPVADPWIALTAIALNTQRMCLGPMVTPLPRRDPFKLARETVTLDHLSGGRLILGVGSGAGPWEWEYLGHAADPKIRGRMLDEGLEVLAGLWSGEPFAYHDTYYTVRGDLPEDRAQFLPATRQQPRIPIWVGGAWPSRGPVRRAARWDGIIPLWDEKKTPQDLCDLVATLQQHRGNLDDFEVVVSGATDEVTSTEERSRLKAYADAGATWWLESIEPWRFGWNWQGDWPVEAMNGRIRSGPPRL